MQLILINWLYHFLKISCFWLLIWSHSYKNHHRWILQCTQCLFLSWVTSCVMFNTLRPRQNGRHFADDIFKRIFLNENIWILIKISLKFVPKGSINNIPALVQIMAWRRPGDKPLAEPMMVNLPTQICVTRPQWVRASLSCQTSTGHLRERFVISIISPS